MKRKASQIIAAMLAALLVVSAVPLQTAFAQPAVTQSDIQGIKDELGDIQARKEEIDGKLASIRSDLSQAKEQAELIQEQVLLCEQEINASQAMLDRYDVQIADKEQEIRGLEEQEAEQYEEFYRQVRWMEENGSVSILSVLFQARSFSELLDYAMLLADIMSYSETIIQRLEATQAELGAAREALQGDRDAQSEVQRELEGRRTELEDRRAQAQALLNQIAASESEFAAEAQRLADSEARINRELKEAEERFAQQLAALESQQPGGVNVSGGGWYWPLPGRYYLSSLFGGRILYGVYDNHTGTDIPAPSGTPIYAANDGVVTTVNRNPNRSSYGYYCTISHGSGYVTLYAHQCQIPLVTEGQTVSKGQVIGYVGTTGNSSGNHLHFELRVNGVRGNVLRLYPGMSFTYCSNGQTITIQGG